MDSRNAAIQSRSTTSSTSIRDKIVDFDNLRENVAGKLSLENWMVLPSHRSLHIFSLNKMLNGNLSIRNTIFIDVNLVVKVFGEDNDETLFSLKLYSWPQLQTLIEQCGAQVKREVDLEFIDVVDKSANSVTNTREIKHQQKDTLPDEFCGINTKPEAEVSDLHKTFIELIETSILEDEASGHNSDFVSQGSFFDEAPLLYSEDGYHNTPSTANEIHIRHSQICSICSKSCVVGEMDRHMQQHFNGKLYQCYICGREYRHTHDLERHAKSKHIATRDEFFCDICKSGRVFETKASIEDHMKNRHWKAPIKEQEMNCSACNKDFLTLKQFRTHMRRHEEIKRQPCPICNKSYRCLSRHIKDIHFNIRNHVCDICGSAYKQWNTLKEHIEIQHSPHAEFFCDICQDGKGYRSKGYIKKHFAKVHIKAGQRRKNARKPFYECSFCNVKLPSRYSLKKHVSLPHNDGKHPIFPCKTCDKTFTLKSSLAAHERTHIWHICHESGQPINHPDYLKKHLKQKKDMNKRKCTICPREYARNFDLRNHMEKVHGIVIDLPYKIRELNTLQAIDMDSRSTATHSSSTILSTSIRDKIVDFDNLRENVAGKLSLENWMVLPSHRSLHIFSLNQKSNGNLSVRNTIFIDVNLVVKVFGENNDDMLFSLKVYSWPQLQTLIEQCGAQVKREVDLEFVDVVGKAANSVKNSCQQKDTLAIECSGINTKAEAEVFDFHQPLTELIESSIAESEALGYKNTFISQSSFFPEAPLIYSEDGYQNAGLMSYKANDRYMRQSQICSICNESYVIGEMDRHMQQHFNRESYRCHVCGGEFRSLSGIQKHMKSKHFTGRDEFFCDICESEICFETEASIEEHMKSRHCAESIKEQGLNCSTCNKDFVTLKQFKAHMRRHDKSMWKPCPICNKSYSSLSRHMNDKHLNIRNHVCEICGSAYKQWVSLKEHIETHHMPHEEFFCDICNNGKDYRSKAHLKKHFAKVHAKVNQRRKNLCKPFYECEFCNEKLSSRYTLKTHLATRHNVVGDDSNFPCNVCDKTFTLKSSLVVHAKLHTGKLHICRECGQSFNHPNYLRKHLNRHKDIKKRKCTLCEKEYVQNVDLRLHMKKVHGVIVPVRNINIKKM
ncbi:zinc finger protein 423-like [Bradysia coprophila]|uniref:zinc finger protein 423-like n=1 Tax=Bradysia coprophila TaxID=38358 RepID=UPI00187DD742|nr:zinc finger protein 423-like [Bradysia coprophila]